MRLTYISDVLVATTEVPGFEMGLDAAGIVIKVGSGVVNVEIGDRVAFIQAGSMRTNARIDSSLLQKLPEDMTFEEGAAIPTAFAAAYHSLVETARLSKHDTILIHAAPGGFGQAAIAIAQYKGAEIFITVDSQMHKEAVMADFEISEDHIFVYHSLNFVASINHQTGGKGVDVVITTLSGEALSATWDYVTLFGRVVTIRTTEMLESEAVDIKMLMSKNITLSSNNVIHLVRHAPQKVASILQTVFSIIRDGKLRPKEPSTEDLTNIGTVFRNVQSHASLSKQVLKITETSKIKAIPRDMHPLKLNPDASYILAGGLGGVGRGIAIYMAQHGAKHISFLSRSGDSKSAARDVLRELREIGVNAAAYTCDIANRSAVVAVLEKISLVMPPVKGLVQAAMVISDGLFESMSFDSWQASTLPKIQGTWNLHELLPKDLDFFILFSSASGILGNRGQANYAAGNTYQDAITHYRRSQGLESTTLDLGAIGGIGWLSEHQEESVAKRAERLAISVEELFAIFKSAVTGYSDNNTKIPSQLMTGLGTGNLGKLNIEEGGIGYHWLAESARFSYMHKLDTQTRSSGKDHEGAVKLKDSLSAVTSFAHAIDLVSSALVDKIARSLTIPSKEIDVNASISIYGIDSLVAAEMRSWCIRELKSDVMVFEFLGSITLTALARQIAERSAMIPGHVAK
jgi:NADPH:quinone reductase-like Zn-dependent oxidoreductase/NADP-dependent 3-hydroxy acid dehydrogenase YdfG